MTWNNRLKALFRAVGRIFRLALLMGFIAIFLQYSVPPVGDQWTEIAWIVSEHQFDYVMWELGALGAKLDSSLWGVHPFISEAERSDMVRVYFVDLEHARSLERQVELIYAQAGNEQAGAEQAAALIIERDTLRADLANRQTLIEAILEGQVASILIDLGFGTAGQLLPPISMRFTQVPNLLIVSPRDQIRFDISINLDPLPVDQQAALEAEIDEAQDVSSLIVPLGGIALYPAMILETTSLSFAVETFAHEWLHHYLFAFPLGLNYDFAGEARIINETTASLFGRAVAPLVLARYYPELAASPLINPPNLSPTMQIIRFDRSLYQDDLPFDPGAALHETRVTVDELLAAGEVEQAEAYMEVRRQLFVANGYPIRKINQAYFAFYGGYQGDAQGAGGGDPIGDAVRALLTNSPSIHEWIITMRAITTRDQLLLAAGISAPA